MTSSSPPSSIHTDEPVHATLRAAPLLIAGRKPFDAGPLHGRWVRWTPSETGRLGHNYVLALAQSIHDNRNADRGTYVVSSYATPIAWTVADGTLVVPPVRYTTTTARHQYACRAA